MPKPTRGVGRSSDDSGDGRDYLREGEIERWSASNLRSFPEDIFNPPEPTQATLSVEDAFDATLPVVDQYSASNDSSDPTLLVTVVLVSQLPFRTTVLTKTPRMSVLSRSTISLESYGGLVCACCYHTLRFLPTTRFITLDSVHHVFAQVATLVPSGSEGLWRRSYWGSHVVVPNSPVPYIILPS